MPQEDAQNTRVPAAPQSFPPHPPLDRELSLSELYKWSFRIARDNYLRVLPIFLLAGVVNALISTDNPIYTLNLNMTSLPNIGTLSGTIAAAAAYSLVSFLLGSIVLYIAAGIGIWRMDRARRSKSPTEQDQIWRVDYLSLAMTTVVAAVLIMLGAFLLLVGAVILGIMFYLSLAANVIERKGPFGSLGRSRSLVSGRWVKTFALLAGVQVVVYFASAFVGTLVSLPFANLTTSSLVYNWSDGFAEGLVFPLVAASMLVLYYSNLQKEKPPLPPPSPYDSLRPAPIIGSPFASIRYCSQCGEEVTAEERFCHNCGYQLYT